LQKKNDMHPTLIRYSQLGTIFDHLALGVVILSKDRKIVSINRAAEMLTGREASSVVGKYCYNEFLNYLCGGKCKFLELGEMGEETVCSEIDINDQTVGPRSITKIESPIFDADNELVGCIEVFQDHTAFEKLLQRVKFDDRRLKMILNNLDIGVLTVDRAGHVTFFNTMAEAITGYPRAEVLGKPCTTIFPINFCKDVFELKQSLEDVYAPKRLATDVVTRDGRRIPIEAKCMGLRNEEGRVVGGLTTISDLSLKHQLHQVTRERYTFYDMVGRDPAMQNLFDIVPVIAASEATILIEGPTGTGKDLLAKIVHNASGRADKPLVKVNCAAMPDNLLESEMFGYVKGAFTGAEREKPGRFELANQGTIFLNEIGDLPLSLQGKLLRVLEDREFYPLGSRKTTRVDVRIISASNQGLQRLVIEKRFREDLFFRLNVMRLELPALKERRGDIPLLISYILKKLCNTRETRVRKISEEAIEVLLNYEYPGNVRELENILEHALIICQGKTIDRKHLPVSLLNNRTYYAGDGEAVTDAAGPYRVDGDANEKEKIRTELNRCGWNRGKTAASLGMNRTTLWRKMKKYNIAG